MMDLCQNRSLTHGSEHPAQGCMCACLLLPCLAEFVWMKCDVRINGAPIYGFLWHGCCLEGEDWLVGVGIEIRRMGMMVALRVEVDP